MPTFKFNFTKRPPNSAHILVTQKMYDGQNPTTVCNNTGQKCIPTAVNNE